MRIYGIWIKKRPETSDTHIMIVFTVAGVSVFNIHVIPCYILLMMYKLLKYYNLHKNTKSHEINSIQTRTFSEILLF